jgi:hypothetical protein
MWNFAAGNMTAICIFVSVSTSMCYICSYIHILSISSDIELGWNSVACYCDYSNEPFFFPVALLALTGPWPLLQFRIFFYTDGRTPWTSDKPVARPLPIHRTTQTENKLLYRLPCFGCDSNSDLSFRASEDSSWRRPRGHRTRQ